MIGYRMPTHVHIEPGAIQRLPEAARGLGLQSVLVVVDRGIRATPWLEAAERALNETGLRTEIFDDVEPNPRTSTVTRAAEVIRQHELDGVIALGGGSVIDAAKAAAMLANNEQRIEQYEGKNRYAKAPRPFIAIPTTCGTGSEVTWVSVLTIESIRSKISVKGESMFPNVALVDADLLQSLPAELVAFTGADALTHALECTTCLAANPVSDALAEKAISLLFRFLPRAVEDVAGDAEAREAVMRASTLAGLAFTNSDVAAVHCLSESLGGLYDLPHGKVNAVLLLPLMRYHRPAIGDRLAELDSAIFATDPRTPARERADHFLFELEALLRRLGIPAFSSLGVSPDDHRKIAEMATRNGSNRSNPQPMAVASYLEVLAGLR
jgi:alcohol dehydrogenase